MRVLFVSRDKSGKINPFVIEQGESLKKYYGLDIQYYLVKEGGILGYLASSWEIFKIWRKNRLDIVHAHYGLSGLTAGISKILSFMRIKLVVTFHGTDINDKNERRFSILASKLSDFNILVSTQMTKYFAHNKKKQVIPCGIDMDVEFEEASLIRKKLGWDENEFVVLFSSAFDRKVKDPDFAFKVMEDLQANQEKKVRLQEMKGLSRPDVNRYMQASDMLLMCSISEGSPQVVKEAILNGLPIVSNDVGDVTDICEGVENCFVIPKDVESYRNTIVNIMGSPSRIVNNKLILNNFDNKLISKKIHAIYMDLMNR